VLPRHSVRLRIIQNAKLYNSKTDKIGSKKNFKELVKLFFDELCRMGTIEDVLLESG